MENGETQVWLDVALPVIIFLEKNSIIWMPNVKK